LTDPGGAFLADQLVELDRGEWQFEAFTDLRGYLRWNAVPDRRLEHETELVGGVGEWIAARVLGDIAAVLARQRRAVRLELPPEAVVLGFLPWELARVDGRTLAEQRVSVIVDQLPRREVAKEPVGARLRMLAVFSLPDGTGALNLRRERYELARLVQRIAKVRSKAIDAGVAVRRHPPAAAGGAAGAAGVGSDAPVWARSGGWGWCWKMMPAGAI